MGTIESPDTFRERYRVDEVMYVDEMDGTVRAALGRCASPAEAAVHGMRGLNTDSGANLGEVLGVGGGVPKGVRLDESLLYEQLAECRVRKSAAELEVMRYVSHVTSAAHVVVMRGAKPGMMEYQLEAAFMHHVYTTGGCRNLAYTAICACGPNSSVLHYGHAGAPNARQLEEGDMALLDMGAEFHCYASDITCSYPIRGTFDADQRMVFSAVLEAQRQIMGAMRPGTSWAAMHRLMWRVVLTALRGGGVLTGDVDAMMEAELGSVFIPCGMGHLIGIDTHDVGGYLSHTPPRIEEAGIRKLRTARTLEVGMCLTVEPGCYFIDALLDPALADPKRSGFFNRDAVGRLRRFGGVRLEDVVVVTEVRPREDLGPTSGRLCAIPIFQVPAPACTVFAVRHRQLHAVPTHSGGGGVGDGRGEMAAGE